MIRPLGVPGRLVVLPDDGEDNVFVFGSNTRGIHGAGAALTAWEQYGATLGTGFGRMGRSYAIPTVDGASFAPLPLVDIAGFIARFLAEARETPDTIYYLTPIGCGIAGYSPVDIAPLFAGAPSNVVLPEEFRS